MKTVRRIELRWTDDNGHEWAYAVRIEVPVTDAQVAQDYALSRLSMGFDEWRR